MIKVTDEHLLITIKSTLTDSTEIKLQFKDMTPEDVCFEFMDNEMAWSFRIPTHRIQAKDFSYFGPGIYTLNVHTGELTRQV